MCVCCTCIRICGIIKRFETRVASYNMLGVSNLSVLVQCTIILDLHDDDAGEEPVGLL